MKQAAQDLSAVACVATRVGSGAVLSMPTAGASQMSNGLPTSMATRIFFSLRILLSVLSARTCGATSIAGMATSIATVTNLRPIFMRASCRASYR
jgi:hypothetical protein